MSWSECCSVWRYKGHSWDGCLNVGFVVRIESSLRASEPSAAFHGETWVFEKAISSTPASVGLGMMRTSAKILGKTLNWMSYLARSWKLGKWETKDIFINKMHSLSIKQNKEKAVQWRNCFHSRASFSVIWEWSHWISQLFQLWKDLRMCSSVSPRHSDKNRVDIQLECLLSYVSLFQYFLCISCQNSTNC